MLISIIIVNHNTGDILKDCIGSLHKYENTGNIEIIIVDNFSNDNSRSIIDTIKKEYPGVQNVFTDSLISFSAANNLGINISKGKYILIMNPDIIFTEPVLEKLTADLENDSSIGVVSPALTGTDGKFQRNYFQRYPSIRQFIYYHSILSKFFNRSAKRMNTYLENQDIDIKTGKMYYTEQIPCAFFLTERDTLNKAGSLDENFKLFFEDVDLSYRIAKEKRLAVDTSLKITHLGGSSFKSDDNWWLHGRYIVSMIWFFRKHYSAIRTFLLTFLVYLNSFVILFIEYVKKIIGKSDIYRINKHKNLLKLLKNE